MVGMATYKNWGEEEEEEEEEQEEEYKLDSLHNMTSSTFSELVTDGTSSYRYRADVLHIVWDRPSLDCHPMRQSHSCSPQLPFG